MFTVIRDILSLLKNFLASNLLKALGLASGFGGYIYSFILKYVLNKLFKLIGHQVTNEEEKLKEKKALTNYQNEINKPGATADEIKQAGKDYLQN